MNVLSLFDGISGGRIALDRANIKVNKYYASEIDKDAIKVSNKNYPNVVRLGDINNINKDVIENLEKIDLIFAGSPCQGFSRQGTGLNFEHPQSKLFFKFIEVLELIREFNNPDVKFLLENVEMKKEWEKVITDHVGVKPIRINSKLVSAQNRPRIYWTSIDGVNLPKDREIKLNDILEDVTITCKRHNNVMIDNSYSDNEMELINLVDQELRISQATKQGYIAAKLGDGINLSFPTSKTRRGRVVSQKTSTLDTSCNLSVYDAGVVRKLTITELERLQTLPDGYTEGISERARKKAIGNGWTIDVIAHILESLAVEIRKAA